MASNLVDSFKSLITLEVVDKAAAQFGESQEGISKAISGAIPVILTGFVHRARTDEGGTMLQEAKDAASNNLSNFSEGSSVLSKGEDWLNRLYENRAGSIGDTLAGYSGIKTSSAHSLLAMLVPAGLAVIGKHALDDNIATDGFASFLSGQKSNIKAAYPEGLNVGLDNWLDREEERPRVAPAPAPATATTTAAHHAAATTHPTATATAHRADKGRRRGTNWLLILVLLLVVIALVWYFLVSDTAGFNTESPGNDTTIGTGR